jgi:hypothetical protein
VVNKDEDLDALPDGPTGGALVWPVLILIMLAVLGMVYWVGVPWF